MSEENWVVGAIRLAKVDKAARSKFRSRKHITFAMPFLFIWWTPLPFCDGKTTTGPTRGHGMGQGD